MKATLITLGLLAILVPQVFTHANLMAQTSSSSNGLIYTQIQNSEQKPVSQQTTNQPQTLINRQTKKVLDVQDMPKNLVMLKGCDRNGKIDKTLIGFANSRAFQDKNNLKEWVTEFEQVWKAIPKTKKFERVSSDGVRCPNPAWGI